MLLLDITDIFLFEWNALDTTRGTLFILKVNPLGIDCKYNAIHWSTFKFVCVDLFESMDLSFLNQKEPSP